MALQTASTVRSPALRNRCSSLAKAISIGLRSYRTVAKVKHHCCWMQWMERNPPGEDCTSGVSPTGGGKVHILF